MTPIATSNAQKSKLFHGGSLRQQELQFDRLNLLASPQVAHFTGRNPVPLEVIFIANPDTNSQKNGFRQHSDPAREQGETVAHRVTQYHDRQVKSGAEHR
jgi:hypothetical protein